MPAWRCVYWYISWLSDLDALEQPPMSVPEQYRDFYRVSSPSSTPPANGWVLATYGSGKMPLPKVRVMDGPAIEVASAVLASMDVWSADSSEARSFIRARMPHFALCNGLAPPQSLAPTQDSDDMDSESLSEYDTREGDDDEGAMPWRYDTDDEIEDDDVLFEDVGETDLDEEVDDE